MQVWKCVYLHLRALEQAGPFIRMYSLREGDCLGICTDTASALVIEVRLHNWQQMHPLLRNTARIFILR